MNKHNIITTKDGSTLTAEWADRAPDDEDRYADDSIIIRASVEEDPELDDRMNEKRLMTALVNDYMRWIKETRR